MSLSQSATQLISAFVNALEGKFVKKNQGTTNNGKFLKVSSGNVACESVTIPSKTSDLTNDSNFTTATGHNHDSSYISKGSGTNIVLANGTNIVQSTFATSGHNHSGTYAPISHTQASSTITDMDTVEVIVTYTDNTPSETLTLFKQVNSQ